MFVKLQSTSLLALVGRVKLTLAAAVGDDPLASVEVVPSWVFFAVHWYVVV